VTTANEFASVAFDTKMRGYDPDAVDKFQHEVVQALISAEQELASLREAVEAERRVAASSEAIESAASPNSLLSVARRLHDEHVQEGIQKRDALVVAGHASAQRIVSEVSVNASDELSALKGQKDDIQSDIDELKEFEQKYRAGLANLMKQSLEEVSNSGSLEPEPVTSKSELSE